MKYSFLIVLFFSMHTNAQDCSPELLREKPGAWKAGIPGSIQNVGATDLAKEKTVLAGIHRMVASRYSPKGCQALYTNAFGKHLPAGRNWLADPYHYGIFILRYLCDPSSTDKSKHYVDYSTPTTVNIAANSMQWLNSLYAAELAADDFRGYLKLTARPKREGAFYNMGEVIINGDNKANPIKEYRWLITYNDTLPFVYVNRKEYLLIQKKRLEQDIKESPSDKEYLGQFLKNIDAYLKNHSESELNLPAICSWNEEQRFEKFVEEGSPNSFFAVKPNLAYYHRNLPKSTPQFFTVVYKIAHGDPVFEGNIDGIKQAVDFSMLRKMLGK